MATPCVTWAEVLERTELEIQVDLPTQPQDRLDLDGLLAVLVPHLANGDVETVIQRRQHCPQRLTERALTFEAENTHRGVVHGHHQLFTIRGDDAAADGSEDVVHKGLRFGDLGQAGADTLEQARVLDGDGCLVGESVDHPLLALAKQPLAEAIIDIHSADNLAFALERHAQDAA